MTKSYWTPARINDPNYARLADHFDGRVILDAIHRHFFFDRPLPPWIKGAFTFAYHAGTFGNIKTWDEVFGKPVRYGSGSREVNRFVASEAVHREVHRLKTAGRKLTDEEFEAIGRRLGVGGKTTVKALLRRARQSSTRRLAPTPKNSNKNSA